MAIRLCVAGATGRMGLAILGLAAKDPDFEIVSALEHTEHPLLNKPLSVCVAGIKNLNASLGCNPAWAFENAQLLIDFTKPAATINHLKIAAEKGLAVVVMEPPSTWAWPSPSQAWSCASLVAVARAVNRSIEGRPSLSAGAC